MTDNNKGHGRSDRRLPIFVISLVSSQERRAFMRAQFESLGIAYRFFDAVDGKRQPGHYLFQKYNDAKRTRRRGPHTALRLSQLGCFASHYLLWEQCVFRGAPIIVLEDDALLLPLFKEFYDHAAGLADDYGFVWMQPSRKVANQAGLPLARVGSFTVKKFAKGFSGATGYLLAPAQAAALIDYCAEWIYPVDDTMDRFFAHRVEAIGIDPVCTQQNDGLASSINAPDVPSHRPAADILRRESANLVDSIRRIAHNMVFLLRYVLLKTLAGIRP